MTINKITYCGKKYIRGKSITSKPLFALRNLTDPLTPSTMKTSVCRLLRKTAASVFMYSKYFVPASDANGSYTFACVPLTYLKNYIYLKI